MATKTAGSDKLSKIITCSVCLDTYTEPKTLICDHSFCKQCVAKIIRAKLVNRDDIFVAKELSIECPNCKTEHSGFRTVSEMKTSHVITQILDFYQETCATERPSSEATCVANCSCCEKPSKCICLRCSNTYCIPCGKAMLRNSCFEDARVRDINWSKEKQNHCMVAKNDADDYVCIEHSLTLDCFCTDCEAITCIDCFLTSHADHVTKTIESVKKEAVDLMAHLKSVQEGNVANRKDVESGAHRVLEKIDANEDKVIAEFKEQKLKMQNFISLIFDRAVQSYKKVFAEEKERLLKEVTDSNAEGAYHSSLPSANATKRGELSAVCDIGNLRTALAQCKEEEMKIETMMKLLREKETSRDEISLSMNHQEIFKLCLKLFSNISLNPASAGKFCPLGITIKTYESVACVAEDVLPVTLANENKAPRVHATDITEKRNPGVGDRFRLQKKKPKERIQYDRDFLLNKRFWNRRPDLPEMECTLSCAHFTFELKNPRHCQDDEQSILHQTRFNQNMDVRLRPKGKQAAARTAKKKAGRQNQTFEHDDNVTANNMLGHIMPHADQSRHLLQEDLSFNAIRPVGPDVPQPHLSRQRLGGDVYYDAIGPAGPAVPRSHQSYQRIREDLTRIDGETTNSSSLRRVGQYCLLRERALELARNDDEDRMYKG